MKKIFFYILLISILYFIFLKNNFCIYNELCQKAYCKNKDDMYRLYNINSRKDEQKLYPYLSSVPLSDEKWRKEGKQYLKQKEYEQAIIAFRKAIKVNPTSSENFFLLAVAYEKRASDGLPNDKTSWLLLAENAYRQAIALSDNLPARFNLALLLMKQKKYDEAKSMLEYILLVSSNKNKTLSIKAKAALDSLYKIHIIPNLLVKNVE